MQEREKNVNYTVTNTLSAYLSSKKETFIQNTCNNIDQTSKHKKSFIQSTNPKHV